MEVMIVFLGNCIGLLQFTSRPVLWRIGLNGVNYHVVKTPIDYSQMRRGTLFKRLTTSQNISAFFDT